MAGLCLGKLYGRPVIATFHGFTSQHGKSARRTRAPEFVFAFLRPLEKLLVHGTTSVTAESDSFAELITRLYAISPSRITILPHMVDTDLFRFEESRPATPTILFVGSLSNVHGAQLLIRSAAHVKQIAPDFRLVLVGAGPLKQILEEEVSQLGLCDKISFLGLVRDRNRLQKVYADSWVLAIPQDYPGYFLSLVAIEAMSTGRLVVATQTMDPKLKAFGVFTVNRSETDLAQMLATILQMSEDDYRQLALSARHYIENNCSYKRIGQQLEDIYLHATIDNTKDLQFPVHVQL